MITKTSSLINNIISFARDQLKQSRGLDMLPKEKDKLRNLFNEEKHHLVVAMNIFMFCSRHNLLMLDA